jgi:DNA invertase Pin-like site-specific DNA recombinase
MKVIGYVRVSTKDQATEGVSLEAQEERIKAYCVVKDWELMGIFKDEGFSGKGLDRPGVQEVLRLVDLREIDALVIWKIDRLTRSVRDLNELIDLLKAKDVALVSLNENLDTTSATGKLLINLLGSIGQWEREAIGERTKMAMAYLKKNRRVYSRPVFGFDLVANGQLVENPEEQGVIQFMEKQRSQGSRYQQIADHLDSKGVKTKRGGFWQPNTVRKILLNREVALG